MRLEKDKLREFVYDLRAAYASAVSDCGRFVNQTRKCTLMQRALNKPSKSFYVSYEEGTRIIYRMMQYGVSGKKGLNAVKYNDLYRVFLQIQHDNPDMDMREAIQRACDAPAPRFYIKSDHAMKLLNKYIKL